MPFPDATQGLSSLQDWGEDSGLPSSRSQCSPPPPTAVCPRLGRSPSRVPCAACTPRRSQGAGLRGDVTEERAAPALCFWPLREHTGWVWWGRRGG